MHVGGAKEAAVLSRAGNRICIYWLESENHCLNLDYKHQMLPGCLLEYVIDNIMGKHAGSPQSPIQVFVGHVVICSADSPRLNILMKKKQKFNNQTMVLILHKKRSQIILLPVMVDLSMLVNAHASTPVLGVQCMCARLHQLVTWRLCAHGATWRPASSTWRVTHQQWVSPFRWRERAPKMTLGGKKSFFASLLRLLFKWDAFAPHCDILNAILC